MLFFQFHLGDWSQKTRLLTATEKGVYVDLLTFYYSTESAIIRSNYERITNAYTETEKEAAKFIIENFFTEKDGAFYNERAEEEIAKWREKSDKAAKSVKARWIKAKKGKKGVEKHPVDDTNEYTNVDTNVDTNEYTNVDTNVDTDVILTNNHKPLTNINNHNKQLTEIFNEGSARETTEFVDCGDSMAIHAEVPEPVQDSNDDVGLYEETAIDQLERHVEDGLDKVIDDFNHVVTPMEVIALARLYGLKVPRDQRLNDVCARKILTIDHVRKCIEICKNKSKSGHYLIGILRNAVNDPEQYHTVGYHLSSKKYELSEEEDTVF